MNNITNAAKHKLLLRFSILSVILICSACQPSGKTSLAPSPEIFETVKSKTPRQVDSSPLIQVTSTLVPSRTPTPAFCLDQTASPSEVSPITTPLEVLYISSGDIWGWKEGAPAYKISDTRAATWFTISPDGQTIVFESTADEGLGEQHPIELWAIEKDGSNLRKLVSLDQFDALLPGRQKGWVANRPRDYRWLPDTHILTFGLFSFAPVPESDGQTKGYCQLDVDSMALSNYDPPEIFRPDQGENLLSPDGQIIAFVRDEGIDLYNVDGSLLKKDLVRYLPSHYCGIGCNDRPYAAWTPDSNALMAVIWDEVDGRGTADAWRIPIDGSQAEKVATIAATPYIYSYLSPNLEILAFIEQQDAGNRFDLKLVALEGGSATGAYYTSQGMIFYGWSPDSFHFVFTDTWSNSDRLLLGNICGEPIYLLDPPEEAVSFIRWIDAERYLYVSMGEEGIRVLRLGRVRGESTLIGPYDNAMNTRVWVNIPGSEFQNP